MFARPRGAPPSNGGPGGRVSLASGPRGGAFLRTLIAAAFFAAAALSPAAAATPAPTNEDCQACHGDAGAKAGDGRSVFVAEKKYAASIHGQAGVSCVDCHADLAKTSDFPHKERLKPVDCAACHDAAGGPHAFHPGIARAAAGQGKAEASCQACHGSHEVVAVKDAAFRFATARQAVACGTCHAEVKTRFLASEHGKGVVAGTPRAPTCIDCHRTGVTAGSVADPGALKQAQERLCLSCHLKDKAVRENGASPTGFIESYENSVHGAALARGNARAPTCIDCHGAHDMRYGFDSASKVNKMRVQQVCAG